YEKLWMKQDTNRFLLCPTLLNMLLPSTVLLDAADSTPSFGDRKTYQMDPANRLEALREAETDAEEGADFLIVKPSLSYLDVMREVKNQVNLPLVAYNVSGEFAMVKAAAETGWI